MPASEVTIEGESTEALEGFSFPNSYAGILRLGERIERLETLRKDGEWTDALKIAPGEFRSSSKFKGFRYAVKLVVPEKRVDMSRVSWLDSDAGFLMMNDLLPRLGSVDTSRNLTVTEFSLPPGWSGASATRRNERGHYLIPEPEKAVFFVGRSLRERSKRIGSMEFSLITVSQWDFSDGEVSRIAERVIKAYIKLTGFQPARRTVLMLASFPDTLSGPRWSAETRGSTVTLMFGRDGRRDEALARLAVIFTHEFFHLWVPNGLRLEGDYDWFFEGFTLYQALRAALSLGFIDFDEYLKTISRVYNSYLLFPDRDQLSLVEASRRRWTGLSSLVYDKGMLLAFVYDLSLRARTGGKSSLDDIYQALFRLSQDELLNANEAIINLLSAPEGMKPLRTYIEGTGPIELERLIAPYGLVVEETGSTRRLVVKNRLTKDQVSLLHSLGYKN